MLRLPRQRFWSNLSARNAVSAVIFDMGGVIIPSPNPAIEKFEKKNNIPKHTGKTNRHQKIQKNCQILL